MYEVHRHLKQILPLSNVDNKRHVQSPLLVVMGHIAFLSHILAYTRFAKNSL